MSMRMRVVALLCLWCAFPQIARSAPVLADLSNYDITMDSRFNGTRVFVFGARNDSGDVVVVVRGPTKNYIVRKKHQVAGMWVNGDYVKLYDMPDFYALASSRPMQDLLHQGMFARLAIGSQSLFPSRIPEDFASAFTRYQRERRLYSAVSTPLTFMGETLFKAAIDFPDNIPPGRYTAEIYLLKEHMIVGTHSLPIEVSKVGIDAWLYDYAHHHPWWYGLTAVAMALVAGWFAGRLFEKI